MDKMKFETVDGTVRNIDKIAEMFPQVITEVLGEDGKLKRAVKWDVLKQLLSGDYVEGGECYEFTWPGKRAAIAKAAAPIRKTLRPCVEESKNWDTTENLYIEGDNLDVLKLLQESYLGKVKMIYIDPPYNTGSDFIYKDNFTKDRENNEEELGLFDEETDDRTMSGELFKNTEANGRFHSDWCSMIYPVLQIAQDLLTNDGAVFISIDENELHNLQKIADEVFGPHNFIVQLVWAAGRKNDSKYISVSHEYILCYAKNIQFLKDHKILWRERKQGLDDIYAEYVRLVKQYDQDVNAIEKGLKAWYKALPNGHPAKDHKHYSSVDSKGIYFPSDISWPGGGGPKYEFLHPITGRPVKVPSRGWVTSKENLTQWVSEDRVDFGDDETKVPTLKAYLKENEESVPYSVFYLDGRASSKRLANLMGDKVFENPKDEEVISRIIDFVGCKDGDVVFDFFSGSGTTAHSVFLSNLNKKTNVKFILCQLQEIIAPAKTTSEKSKKVAVAACKLLDSLKAPHNICEIGKERIRRAGEKIKKEAGLAAADLDVGFRVFKVADSNMKDVYYSANEYSQGMLDSLVSNIKEDRTDLDLLYGCLLEWGVELSLPHTSETIDGVTVHTVDNGALIACFDANIPESAIRTIAKRQPLRAVFRDSSFASAPQKINVEEIFKLLSPTTTVKVI